MATDTGYIRWRCTFLHKGISFSAEKEIGDFPVFLTGRRHYLCLPMFVNSFIRKLSQCHVRVEFYSKRLNAGDRKGACEAIRWWIKDGGRDCRIRSNNCYGQVIRRDQESALTCWGIEQ